MYAGLTISGPPGSNYVLSYTTDLGNTNICRAYWYPLYAYARRAGQSPPDAPGKDDTETC